MIYCHHTQKRKQKNQRKILNRLDREKFAISKLLSPDQIAEKREMAREIDRVRKENRRTDPLERERYNASQNAIYHQSTVQRNSNACVPAEIQDEYGGWEETKQNSPVRDDGTNSNKVQGVLMGFDNTANAVDWSNHGSDNLEVRTMLQDLQNNNGDDNTMLQDLRNNNAVHNSSEVNDGVGCYSDNDSEMDNIDFAPRDPIPELLAIASRNIFRASMGS